MSETHRHYQAHSHDQPHSHEQHDGPQPQAEDAVYGPEPRLHARPADTPKLLTVRPAGGLSGDMFLAGLAALAELSPEELDALTAELGVPALRGAARLTARFRSGIAGVGCRVLLPHEHEHRTLDDILDLIAASGLPDDAKTLSSRAFRILAEAGVHGIVPEAVAFHEVGALDSILDICLTCRLFALLRPDRLICAPLPLGDGVVRCAHGLLPAPAPAVLRMLSGIPVRGFSGYGETVTPTALCLLLALGAEFGPWPEMIVEKNCIAYGTKTFPNAPNGAVWAIGRPAL